MKLPGYYMGFASGLRETNVFHYRETRGGVVVTESAVSLPWSGLRVKKAVMRELIRNSKWAMRWRAGPFCPVCGRPTMLHKYEWG